MEKGDRTVITECPECGSDEVEQMPVELHNVPGTLEVNDCYCQNCGCKFIERCLKKDTVYEHGEIWKEKYKSENT